MLHSLHLRSSALLLAALAVGCAPKIGNSCKLSTDCSQLGDRLCDATQPDGYCTIFNCEPDTCPESACVGFNAELDPACKGTDISRTPRFERTFCMQPCSDQGDCRDGYKCASPSEGKFKIVDLVNNPLDQKICLAGLDAAVPMSSNGSANMTPNVCGVGDPGGPWTPYKPDGGMDGSSSSSGSSSGSGSSS